MKKPLVSVVMPAYNDEKYVGKAIESILNQTFKDFEFIIIDDASKDKSLEIINKYAKKDKRIIVLKNENNLKICKTLNKGIKIAKGKYIARMDADDWSYPERIKKQVEFMEKNPKVVICGGTMEVCNLKLNPINKREYNETNKEIRNKIFYWSPFCHATVIYKTNIIRKVGGYDPRFPKAQDYDLYFRLGNEGEFANLKDTLFKMRVNPAGSTFESIRQQEKYTLEIRKKATKTYGYKMNIKEKIYYFAQKMSLFVIPPKLKYSIFNFLRSKIK
jgi:glycosyltransferase involved in cell wall biosynthesis